MTQTVKHLPAKQETQVRSLGREDPLEKEMATHSSNLICRIPQTEDLGRVQSRGSQRVGTRLSNQAHTQFTHVRPNSNAKFKSWPHLGFRLHKQMSIDSYHHKIPTSITLYTSSTSDWGLQSSCRLLAKYWGVIRFSSDSS